MAFDIAIERVRATTIAELPTGRCPMLTEPDIVESILESLAEPEVG